jgi:phosphoesterase RecJ-like protein
VLITGHVQPDGDSIGSSLALMFALEWMGKTAAVYSEDPVPYNYAFLPGAGAVVCSLPEGAAFDHSVLVDMSDKDRVGCDFPWDRAGVLLNIDHHATGPGLGSFQVRDDEASATGELIHDLIEIMGVPFTKEIAVNLYCALLTDTGSFHYSNSTPEAFEIAGKMVRAGVDPWGVASAIYEKEPKERMKLLGLALRSLQISCEGKLATVAITGADYTETGGTKEMTDQFVNFARAIDGVEVAAMLRELPDGSFKVSMRSRDLVDVSLIGLRFGGGGHRNAAGFNTGGPLTAARAAIAGAVSAALGIDSGKKS